MSKATREELTKVAVSAEDVRKLCNDGVFLHNTEGGYAQTSIYAWLRTLAVNQAILARILLEREA